MSVLTALFRGKGAHADSISCFEGLTLELAGRRLPRTQHSIWKELWHLNYWMDHELRSIAGPEVPTPEHASASWPDAPDPPDAAAWEAGRARFESQINQFMALASHLTDGDRIVHPKTGESVRDVLMQMIAHNSYHIGQVVQMRRAFDVWPPAGGGDTW
ncbi:MAG: DinB family protein [Gemmatimonadota bacterium]